MINSAGQPYGDDNILLPAKGGSIPATSGGYQAPAARPAPITAGGFQAPRQPTGGLLNDVFTRQAPTRGGSYDGDVVTRLAPDRGDPVTAGGHQAPRGRGSYEGDTVVRNTRGGTPFGGFNPDGTPNLGGDVISRSYNPDKGVPNFNAGNVPNPEDINHFANPEWNLNNNFGDGGGGRMGGGSYEGDTVTRTTRGGTPYGDDNRLNPTDRGKATAGDGGGYQGGTDSTTYSENGLIRYGADGVPRFPDDPYFDDPANRTAPAGASSEGGGASTVNGGASEGGINSTLSSTAAGNIYGIDPATYDPATMNPSAVSDALTKLLSKDGDYLKLAETNALQGMNTRGLLNSSLAVGAGQAAAIDRALPIAQGDAQYQNAADAFNATAGNQAHQFNAGAVNTALTNFTNALNSDLSQAAGINSQEQMHQASLDMQWQISQAANEINQIQDQNQQNQAWASLTNQIIQTGITNGVFAATDNEQADIDRIAGYLRATLTFLPDGGQSIIDQFVDDIVNDIAEEEAGA